MKEKFLKQLRRYEASAAAAEALDALLQQAAHWRPSRSVASPVR